LRLGNYVEHAASTAGIARSTIYEWLRKGEAALAIQEAGEELDEMQQRYLDFMMDVDRARSEAITTNLQMIQDAAPKNWQAAAWYLERTAPAFFGRHMRTEITGPDNGPVQVEVSKQELVNELLSVLEAMDDNEDES
jgi:AcrR family transcriptional regulator